MHHRASILSATVAFAAAAFAAETAPAAKTYGPFFAPVAIEDRRALSVDRSNFTYSPSGINSGVFQVETSMIEYTSDSRTPDSWGVDKITQFSFGTTSLRLGMTDDFEAQLITTAHTYARVTDTAGDTKEYRGFGDTLLQARYTVAGNNGEKYGFAIMPYVKLPTNTLDGYANHKLEGGVQLPVARSFSDKLSGVAASGFDLNYDTATANTYTVNPFLSVALWYTASPDSLFLFNEVYLKRNTAIGQDAFTAYYGLGGVYQINRDCGLDFGVNLGLTEATADLYARTGVTFRF